MNKNISAFYTANRDNVTVAFGSNLKEMWLMLTDQGYARSYHWLYTKMKAQSLFTDNGLTIQKVFEK